MFFRKQLIDQKEITKAKQLVGQLRWLLDHCWEGDESKPLVPEMLWRARKGMFCLKRLKGY